MGVPGTLHHGQEVQGLLTYLVLAAFLGLLLNQGIFPPSDPSESPHYCCVRHLVWFSAAFLLIHCLPHPSQQMFWGPFGEDSLFIVRRCCFWGPDRSLLEASGSFCSRWHLLAAP